MLTLITVISKMSQYHRYIFEPITMDPPSYVNSSIYIVLQVYFARYKMYNDMSTQSRRINIVKLFKMETVQH